MSARGVLRVLEGGQIAFWCAGCKESHPLDAARWKFDGNYEKPTLSPSVLVTSGHYVSTFKPGDACWCTYNAEHPDKPASFHCQRCHSFVRAGVVEFLMDCTHELAGKSVPLEPF